MRDEMGVEIWEMGSVGTRKERGYIQQNSGYFQAVCLFVLCPTTNMSG